jgi:hypothetical protein
MRVFEHDAEIAETSDGDHLTECAKYDDLEFPGF